MIIGLVLLFMTPFVMLIVAGVGYFVHMEIVMATCLLLAASNFLVINSTDTSNSLFAIVGFPFVIIAEIVVAIISMVRYEFFAVHWKERNICTPVMHVYPKLPQLNNS